MFCCQIEVRSNDCVKMMAVLFILCASFHLVSSCPTKCSCPLEVPRCALGVRLVPDGCGCCRVCARQLNEDCSQMEPCDYSTGLECNFGAGHGRAKGICRAKSHGRACEYNSNMYQNGESFYPNCKHQCTCLDGAVGCIPLCPRELSLPRPGCTKPRLAKGRCCEKRDCLEEVKSEVRKPSDERRGDKRSEDELIGRNELVSGGRGGGRKSSPAFKSQPKSRMLSNGSRCVTHTTTAWSPCSKSCGPGVSSRVTNRNNRCKLLKETRLCEVHPCSQTAFSSSKRGKKRHVEKARQPVKFTYAGCRSLKEFRPRYCGPCCSPRQTQTMPVHFRCGDGKTFVKDVMRIQSCSCDFSCAHNGDKTSAVYRR